jgi:hypothetical protein
LDIRRDAGNLGQIGGPSPGDCVSPNRLQINSNNSGTCSNESGPTHSSLDNPNHAPRRSAPLPAGNVTMRTPGGARTDCAYPRRQVSHSPYNTGALVALSYLGLPMPG